jgi:hypothetical protein
MGMSNRDLLLTFGHQFAGFGPPLFIYMGTSTLSVHLLDRQIKLSVTGRQIGAKPFAAAFGCIESIGCRSDRRYKRSTCSAIESTRSKRSVDGVKASGRTQTGARCGRSTTVEDPCRSPGSPKFALEPLRSIQMQFKFYLYYGMRSSVYDRNWQTYYQPISKGTTHTFGYKSGSLFDKDRRERKQHRQAHCRCERSEDAHCEVLFSGVLDALKLDMCLSSDLSGQRRDAITPARSLADDVRSNFGRHRQSQKFPLPACRVVHAHLYTAIGWHSVPPREEAIQVSLPSRPESISAERVHVEVGKAGSLYPFG